METIFVGLRKVKEMILVDRQVHIKPEDEDSGVLIVDLVDALKKNDIYLDFKLYDTQIKTFNKLHVEDDTLYLIYDTYNFDGNIETIGEISQYSTSKDNNNIRYITPYIVMCVEPL